MTFTSSLTIKMSVGIRAMALTLASSLPGCDLPPQTFSSFAITTTKSREYHCYSQYYPDIAGSALSSGIGAGGSHIKMSSAMTSSSPRGGGSLDTLVSAAIERGPVHTTNTSSSNTTTTTTTTYQPYRPSLSSSTSYNRSSKPATNDAALQPIHIPGVPQIKER